MPVEKFLRKISESKYEQQTVPSWKVSAVRSDILTMLSEMEELYSMFNDIDNLIHDMFDKLKRKLDDLVEKFKRVQNYGRLALRDLTGEEY